MKDLLVGSTGFVGGNLLRSHDFSAVCHSTDVSAYYDSRPELCVYAGVPAAMYLANTNPALDFKSVQDALENLRRICPRRLVLISSTAVYGTQNSVDEYTEMDTEGLSAYGKNRLLLEEWVRSDWPDALIVRLPALYGRGIKKNFLYDLHTIVPAALSDEKYRELSKINIDVKAGYSPGRSGFYGLNEMADPAKLLVFFRNHTFNALSFTDSRSRYQFYHLNRLWSDLTIGIGNQLKTLNLCTPPVTAREVYQAVTGRDDWDNKLAAQPFGYDMKSAFSSLFGGENGYLLTKEEELSDIKRFMKDWE